VTNAITSAADFNAGGSDAASVGILGTSSRSFTMTIDVSAPTLSVPDNPPSEKINHQLTFDRPHWQPRKQVCTTLAELDQVIDHAITWKVYTWDEYTGDMIRETEFGGEALRKIMQAGLESLAKIRLKGARL
jgi:hypothetical protein